MNLSFIFNDSVESFMSSARNYFKEKRLPVKVMPSAESEDILIIEIRKMWSTSRLYFQFEQSKVDTTMNLVATEIAMLHKPFKDEMREYMIQVVEHLDGTVLETA